MKRNFRTARLVCAARISITFSLLLPVWAHAIDVQRDDVQAFVNELVTDDQFDREYLQAVLGRSEVQQSILDAMSRPAEKVKPWHEYRAIFMTPERIEAGVKFYAEHRESLLRIQAETGVPPEMILGIIGVESYFGRITGKHKVGRCARHTGFRLSPALKVLPLRTQPGFHTGA